MEGVDEFFADGAGELGEAALFVFVGLAAFWSLDGDGWDVPCREVVGAGTHVEIAELAGELEGFEEDV